MCEIKINPDYEEAMKYITKNSLYNAYYSEEQDDCVLEWSKDADKGFWIEDQSLHIEGDKVWTLFKSEDQIIELAYDVAVMNNECPHPVVDARSVLVAMETRIYPAEYSIRGFCAKCGEYLADDDIPHDAEIRELH